MEEPTNLERAMRAENALCSFDEEVRVPGIGLGPRPVDDLYDPPQDVAKDLVTDLCHFLNLDERADCMSTEAIEDLLVEAFAAFKLEKQQESEGPGMQFGMI